MEHRTKLLATLLLSIAPASLAAAQSPSPGHRLFSPRPGTDTFLVDDQGEIVHSWPSAHSAGLSVRLLQDGTLVRAIVTGSTVAAVALNGEGGGIQMQAWDGTLLWDYRYDTNGVLQHHDIEVMPNGNVLFLAWDERTEAEALALGRDPALASGLHFPDSILEVRPTGPTTGTIVWEWHAWDHLIQDHDATKGNYGVVADHPELIDINWPPGLPGGELHHLNSVDYDPVHDLIVVSAHTQNEIWVIDHGTTTAEAAGHTGGARGKGGDLLYRWGNPQVYGRGTSLDQTLFKQHSAKFVPSGFPGAGNLTIFNNQVDGNTRSEVIEIELPLDALGDFVDPGASAWGPAAPVWSYADGTNFYSQFMSSAERLPNGNTLICSSLQGRLFEIQPDGTNVWELAVPSDITSASFMVAYVERTLWQTNAEVSARAGGTTELDLSMGTEFAGDAYMLVGSLAGTSPGFTLHGFHVPLNIDSYFRYLFRVPAGPYHAGNFGLLDATGSAHATFTVPPGVATAGLEFDHLFLTAHPTRYFLSGVSNVERMTITP